MAEMMMIGSIVVGIVNAILAVVLLAVYRGVYRNTRAPFTLALLIFAFAFLLQNLLVVYSYVTMMPVAEGMAPYLLGIGVLEAGGLGAMGWTATR